jgi:hypothetical protein
MVGSDAFFILLIPNPQTTMENHEIYRLESISLEIQSRAKNARSAAAVESKQHGEVSIQSQRYAFEACAYEYCARELDRAIEDLSRMNAERTRPL